MADALIIQSCVCTPAIPNNQSVTGMYISYNFTSWTATCKNTTHTTQYTAKNSLNSPYLKFDSIWKADPDSRTSADPVT
jgi:hypothetical protein